MSFQKQSQEEIERNRLRRASQLASECGEDWAEPYRAGSCGCHELLDRTALLADLVESHLLEHPACVANSSWYQLAEQAAEALRELYQKIGAEHLENESTFPQKEWAHQETTESLSERS